MGAKYTEAQKNASLNYQQSKAQVKITIEKEERENWQEYAKSKGKTLTELIRELVEKEMKNNM